MTEANIGFLYKIASNLPQNTSESQSRLRSYYLMRCKELTRGYGLPEKHFSSKVRCPYCCLEWSRNSEIKVKSIQLSKRQKKRIKSKKTTNFNKYHVENRKNLLHSNEIEQICTFCHHSIVTQTLKPKKENDSSKEGTKIFIGNVKVNNKAENFKNTIITNRQQNEEKSVNVYSNAFDIFSIKNQNNTLKNKIKDKPKLIKNNKKKKDKFAGLCQAAVIASAKIKEDKVKNDKLNMFLRPSN